MIQILFLEIKYLSHILIFWFSGARCRSLVVGAGTDSGEFEKEQSGKRKNYCKKVISCGFLGDAEESCQSSSSEQGVRRRAGAQLPHVRHREGGSFNSTFVTFNINSVTFNLNIVTFNLDSVTFNFDCVTFTFNSVT